jgi:hypothetical protein
MLVVLLVADTVLVELRVVVKVDSDAPIAIGVPRVCICHEPLESGGSFPRSRLDCKGLKES